MRADLPYKSLADVRRAKEPPKCGSLGAGTSGSFLPLLLETTLGTKFNIIAGYQGGGEVDLAVERGELHCRTLTIQAYHSREPYHTWRKKNFTRILMQTGQSRDSRLADVPTLRELMDEFKTPPSERRLVPLVMASSDFGRPIIAPPGVPAERLRVLRDAFLKTMKDPDLLAEAKRKNFDIKPSSGEELEALAKHVMSQPQEVVDRVKLLMEK
ncbi:MAG TPA: tripartite tricarboxylate transporter substrate-binding protein, partial [Candidatus Limnocylindria bacterium]|nr:tripartite tricarboxylate transporter substrate-binding protein [Candidatus Limnocylindria bacterium]